tara:strand:- start:3655 stop:5235 length:1581 start_codon:yes stop_codon:yes gene_type:complete
MKPAPFTLLTHNPDVLNCIANLSNDEVFTPPEFVDKVLDTLEANWAKQNNGENIWNNKNVTFLDPCTKSGAFLREIVRRLSIGLSSEFKNLDERVDHILKNQVFGIGITELTALITRRSIYCSKFANSKYSISKFNNKEGNIFYERTFHEWKGNSCIYCSANLSEYDRNPDLETHAYLFIHTENINEYLAKIFKSDMRFDVVIGNPPYQLNDGGGDGFAAVPIYHKFVDQAKKLDPQFLVMIIPARWYSGGRGLNKFRFDMLNDSNISEIHDFPETDMVFPGQNIRGGVCYFLRSKSHSGNTKVVNYKNSEDPISAVRPLLEPGLDTFVRYNEAISILKKVRSLNEETYETRVQSSNPYGMRSYFSNYSKTKTAKANIVLFRSRREASEKEVFVEEKYITNNIDFKDKIKVLVSKASPGGDEYPHKILGKPFISPKNSVSTETYLIIDFVKNHTEGNNLISYMESSFFRFLVSLIKNTQNISKSSFAFVPIQDLSKSWNDEVLFKKYKISKNEQKFISTMIRPIGE